MTLLCSDGFGEFSSSPLHEVVDAAKDECNPTTLKAARHEAKHEGEPPGR